MPSFEVRDLPQAIYRRLAEQAEREHRTLSEQVTVLLSSALDAESRPRDRRRALLSKLSQDPIACVPTDIPAPETLIREDRDR